MILQLKFFLRVAVELFGPRKSLNAEWPTMNLMGLNGTIRFSHTLFNSLKTKHSIQII